MQLVLVKIYRATKIFLDSVVCTRLSFENNSRVLFNLQLYTVGMDIKYLHIC